MNVVKTDLGTYTQDQSGLWHYHANLAGILWNAAEDALRHKPGVSWFWFSGTFAPIFEDDKDTDLLNRWHAWRVVFIGKPITHTLEMLKALGETVQTD